MRDMKRDKTTLGNRAQAPLLIGVPLAVVVETLVSLMMGWRPYGKIEVVLMLAVFAAAAAMLWAAFSLRFRVFLARHGAEFVLACAGILAGWTLLELGARHIEERINPPKYFHTRGPNVRSVFHPNPELFLGVTGTSHYSTDRFGIRAPQPPTPNAKHRVLCVGGSTTECTYLDDTETWAALLSGGSASLWVGDAGISGFGTLEHADFLASSPLLDDIDLVVMQAGINDLWRYLAREEKIILFNRFEEAKAQSKKPHANEAVLRAHAPVWTRSNVIQLWHTLRQPPPKAHEVEGVMGTEYAIRRQRRMDAVITDAAPDLAAGLDAFRENLKRIIATCRKRGIGLVLTTQPVLWRADLSPDLAQRCWFGWLQDGRYLSLGQLRAAMDQYNAVTRTVCSEGGIPCVDLDAMNGNAAYFHDDCHFTEAGARTVAAMVSPTVIKALQAP